LRGKNGEWEKGSWKEEEGGEKEGGRGWVGKGCRRCRIKQNQVLGSKSVGKKMQLHHKTFS